MERLIEPNTTLIVTVHFCIRSTHERIVRTATVFYLISIKRVTGNKVLFVNSRTQFVHKIFGVDSSIKKGTYGELLFIKNKQFYRGTLDGKQVKF